MFKTWFKHISHYSGAGYVSTFDVHKTAKKAFILTDKVKELSVLIDGISIFPCLAIEEYKEISRLQGLQKYIKVYDGSIEVFFDEQVLKNHLVQVKLTSKTVDNVSIIYEVNRGVK